MLLSDLFRHLYVFFFLNYMLFNSSHHKLIIIIVLPVVTFIYNKYGRIRGQTKKNIYLTVYILEIVSLFSGGWVLILFKRSIKSSFVLRGLFGKFVTSAYRVFATFLHCHQLRW